MGTAVLTLFTRFKSGFTREIRRVSTLICIMATQGTSFPFKISLETRLSLGKKRLKPVTPPAFSRTICAAVSCWRISKARVDEDCISVAKAVISLSVVLGAITYAYLALAGALP